MFPRTILVALVILTFACQKTETTTTETVTSTDTAPTAPPTPTELTEGFATPESVLYDAEQDVYFVSNINGAPLGTDDNGYISRVSAETLQVESKWIDGAKPEVTLNAPKGMAISGDDLWVSDITTVRRFDRKTGAPKGEVAIKGTTFLNDVVSDGTNLYVSDSGLNAEFKSTGTDAIWKISNNKATKFASGKDLNGPNGLAVVSGSVWAVSFRANELYRIENGKKADVTTLPQGGLDGLVHLNDFLVSSWDGKGVYRVSHDDKSTTAPPESDAIAKFKAHKDNPTQVPISQPVALLFVGGVDSPADIGYDTKRNRLLIPHFMENKVSIRDVP